MGPSCMVTDEQKKKELKQLIEAQVFITAAQESIGTRDDPQAWTFDFRRVLMNGRASDLITELFYEEFRGAYPFQVCTLEIGGVPLATSIMNKLYAKGHHDSNAFFIRKSRKKTNLFRMVEGQIQDEKKIILVDDVINSGDSFWRQIEVLEALGYTVDTVWSLLRYRDETFYTRFARRNIKVKSLFTLDDFTDSLGPRVKNRTEEVSAPVPMPFTAGWAFQSEYPSLGWVCSKSQPILDEKKIYVGSDHKFFWALNQVDGSVAWKFAVGPVAKKKAIFSNPAFYHDLVILGAYDGNVYGLSRENGAVKWVSMEADWVGSSPAVAHDLGLLFIGLEYGLLTKMGGLAAIDATTGKSVWIDRSHQAMTHSSPRYITEHQQVVIGSNDGVVRLHDAKKGTVLWKFTTFGAADYDPLTWVGRQGYSNGDIKEGFAYSPKHDYIIFGSIDGFLYVLDRKTGFLVHHEKCAFGIFSTPYIYNDRVYFTAADKTVRCLDLTTRTLLFAHNVDNTRIFASPVVINGRLYVGTNAGRLHELDPETGEKLGYFQTKERITNNVIYNRDTDTYFLPTYANEIIQLKRADTGS